MVDQEGDNARRLVLFNFFFVVVVNKLDFEHCMCGRSDTAWKDWDSSCNNWSGMLNDVVVGDAMRMRGCFKARDDCDPVRHHC
jgi:hypothetical protein